MDPNGARRTSGIVAVLCIILIVAGAAMYLAGLEIPGIIVAIIAVAVLVICLGIRSFLNAFAMNQMVRGAGKNKKDRDPREVKLFCGRPLGASIESQYLLLSAGWCFLKQSLQ